MKLSFQEATEFNWQINDDDWNESELRTLFVRLSSIAQLNRSLSLYLEKHTEREQQQPSKRVEWLISI